LRAFGTSKAVRVLAAAVAIAGTAATATFTSAPSAVADIGHQIAVAKARLATLERQAEAASERFDHARDQLLAARGDVTAARQTLAAANLRVQAHEKSFRSYVAELYEQGGSSTAGLTPMLLSGTTSQTLQRLSQMRLAATAQERTVVAYAAARRSQEQAAAEAAAALTKMRGAEAAALTARRAIQDKVTEAQHLLRGLRAKQARLIAAARRRAARRAAEARAAALARQQAALAAAASAVQAQPLSSPPIAPVHASGNVVATAIAVAKQQLGKPYVWGAAGPNSFDCSGLTMYAYGRAGVALPHYTGDQWNVGRHVSESELQPGDLVFFNTDEPLGHVGMYLGGGEFIQAPHTGTVVQITPLSGYYQEHYAGAVRVVG